MIRSGMTAETLHNLTIAVTEADTHFECGVRCTSYIGCEAFVHGEGICSLLSRPMNMNATSGGLEYFQTRSNYATCVLLSHEVIGDKPYSFNTSTEYVKSYQSISMIRAYADPTVGILQGFLVKYGEGEVASAARASGTLVGECYFGPGEYINRVDVSITLISGLYPVVSMLRFVTSQQSCECGNIDLPVESLEGYHLLYMSGDYFFNLDRMRFHFEHC